MTSRTPYHVAGPEQRQCGNWVNGCARVRTCFGWAIAHPVRVMRKRRICLLLLCTSVSAAVVVLLLIPSREPVYGGRTLTEWVMAMVRREPTDWDYETRRAIYLIGTNAVPNLIKWMLTPR